MSNIANLFYAVSSTPTPNISTESTIYAAGAVLKIGTTSISVEDYLFGGKGDYSTASALIVIEKAVRIVKSYDIKFLTIHGPSPVINSYITDPQKVASDSLVAYLIIDLRNLLSTIPVGYRLEEFRETADHFKPRPTELAANYRVSATAALAGHNPAKVVSDNALIRHVLQIQQKFQQGVGRTVFTDSMGFN